MAECSQRGMCNEAVDLRNERLALRAAAYRMWRALVDIDEQAMTLLAGRTDAWPLIDALERGQAAYLHLAEHWSEDPYSEDPYLDDEKMLRSAGSTLDVRRLPGDDIDRSVDQ